MSSITRGHDLWKVVEAAFGLQGRHISRLVLDLRVGEPPRIRITEYMTDDAEREIVRIFEQGWHEVTEK